MNLGSKWFVVSGFLFALPALADLSAQTTRKNFRLPQQALTLEQRVAGSQVEGSWTEAFIDFAQFVAAVKTAVDGNVAAGYTAYNEFNQFLDAVGDHASYDRGNVRAKSGVGYDFMRLKFVVTSDDDPVGQLNIAYPNGGSLAAGFQARITGKGTRTGTATLDIYPSRIPPGKYPIAFYTKETDCSTCLSITHVIDLNVEPPPPPPQQCGPLPIPCRTALIERDRAENGVRIAFDRKRSLIEGIQRRGGRTIHAAITYEKQHRELCNHVGSPGSPQVEACLDRIPQDLEGFCPHLAFGVRHADGVCDQLAGANSAIDAALALQERMRSNLQGMNCCPKPPGGPINN